MVLLQQAAAAAARFYDHAELTELHHNRKADAPSGTCIKTAELMEELGKSFNPEQVEEHESLEGSRGGRQGERPAAALAASSGAGRPSGGDVRCPRRDLHPAPRHD